MNTRVALVGLAVVGFVLASAAFAPNVLALPRVTIVVTLPERATRAAGAQAAPAIAPVAMRGPFVIGRVHAIRIQPAAEPPLGPASSHQISRPLLERLVRACAADVDPTTQEAIVDVESGANAWALHDDNTNLVYAPARLIDATALATDLIAQGHRRFGARDRGVDVGLGQVNSQNFGPLGVSATTMLDPCQNLRASSRIIAEAYEQERARVGSDQIALRRALQVYNSGRSTGDDRYVQAVVAAVPARDRAPIVPALAVDAVDAAQPGPPLPAPRPDAPPRSGLFVHVDVGAEAPAHAIFQAQQ